jgi:hypothetical protein
MLGFTYYRQRCAYLMVAPELSAAAGVGLGRERVHTRCGIVHKSDPKGLPRIRLTYER